MTILELPSVLVEKEDNVAILWLNRPEKLNALNAQLGKDLGTAVEALRDDKSVRAIVYSGKGRSFCAGGDLKEISEKNLSQDPVAMRAWLQELHRGILGLVNIEKPVVTAVNGYAVGAGFSLAMLGDLMYAADDAHFSQAFVNVGVVPDMGSMFLLPMLVGPQRAKDLIFSGRQIGATEAKEMGLVSRIIPAGQLIEESLKAAKQLAAGPVKALGMAKAIINEINGSAFREALAKEAYAQSIAFQTDEAEEGLQAFLAKRKPRFI